MARAGTRFGIRTTRSARDDGSCLITGAPSALSRLSIDYTFCAVQRALHPARSDVYCLNREVKMNPFSGPVANGTLLRVALIWTVACGFTPVALAQTGTTSFVVNTLADSGSGSLRQAILDANGRPGPNEIDFAPGLHGTIVLTSGALPITDSLT